MRCRCNNVGAVSEAEKLSPPLSPSSSGKETTSELVHRGTEEYPVLARPYPLIHVDAMSSVSQDECDDADIDEDAADCYDHIIPNPYGIRQPWYDITPDSLMLSHPYRFHHVDAMAPINENPTSCDEVEVLIPSPAHGSSTIASNRRGRPRN